MEKTVTVDRSLLATPVAQTTNVGQLGMVNAFKNAIIAADKRARTW